MPGTKTRAKVRYSLPFTLAASLSACGSPQDAGPSTPADPAAALRGRVALPAARPNWATPERFVRPADPHSLMGVQVYLRLHDQDAARAELAAINDPQSPHYGQYLTTEEFRSRYAPTAAEVEQVRSFLRGHGLTVGYVPENNLYVSAQGTVSQMEEAFGTHVAHYQIDGREVRAPMSAPSLPAQVAPLVVAIPGLDEGGSFIRPRAVRVGGVHPDVPGRTRPAPHIAPGTPAPPPPGTRDAVTCSRWWAEKLDKTDPAYGGGFPNPLPYLQCGYKPPQLRAAYGLEDEVKKGNDGHGVTVAIVDAFAASPTLFSDAQTYAAVNDPDYPLSASQFKALLTPGMDPVPPPDPTEVQGWYGEETLDVEAAHTAAPGANITFVGARSSSDDDLIAALNYVIDHNLASIVSNSWGGSEILTLTYIAFEGVAIQAGLKGVGLYFASGDEGDLSLIFGIASAGFPASLPEVTAVGGTSLGTTRLNGREFEVGWEGGAIVLQPAMGMTPASYNPPAPGGFFAGGGGSASRVYLQPSYQKGVVPAAMADVYGPAARVVPDVAMVGDPFTGFLIGETQTFPDGVYYDQFTLGGTSLSCPLFAGIIALTEQKGHRRIGFANPKLYRQAGKSAYYDIKPGSKRAVAAEFFSNGVDATGGLTTVVGTLEFPGQTIKTAAGYDNVTGLGVPNGASFLNTVR